MKNKFLMLLLLLFVANTISAQDRGNYFITKNNDTINQVDGIDYLRLLFKIKKNQDSIQNKKVHFSFFPTDTHNAGGRVLVSSFNATFLLGDKSNTNNSTIYLIPYISFNKQFGLELYPTIWLKKNSWNFVGEYFILNFPQETWGLGGNTPNSNETFVDGDQIRFYQNILKGILPNLAIGLGYQLDKHYNLSLADDAVLPPNSYYSIDGVTKSVSSGVAFTAVFDSRKNIINPQKGFYTNFTYRYNSPSLGSDTEWQSLFFDARKYFTMPQFRSLLAFRTYYWTTLSGEVPYFDLPSTRSDPAIGSSSRGIQKNRYRSNAMLYFETEYRFNISPNGFLGGVIFTNVASASEYKTQNFDYWQPAAGVGIRLKFNKYTKVNVALDLGFSKDYISVYFNIGEAF